MSLLFYNVAVFRFTVGNTNKWGIICLEHSIAQIRKLYKAEIVVCYNGNSDLVAHLPVTLVNQHGVFTNGLPDPIGVSWKLYPPRLYPTEHEIFIDNDLILHEHIEEIDDFLASTDKTLLLEEENRVYGRFSRHVPKNLRINTGLFGVPPNFNLETRLKAIVGKTWEHNALGKYEASWSWDEQGAIAYILSSQKYTLIPKESITNCARTWIRGKGNHFIGLNRDSQKPFKAYLLSKFSHL